MDRLPMPAAPLTAPSAPPPSPLGAAASWAGVQLHAPGRLHLGFMDPAATLGRRFGSLGLVIEGFETVVRLRRLDGPGPDRVDAAEPAAQAEVPRAARHLAALRAALPPAGPACALHLSLLRVLPAHAGFGSGTQLALAVGRAYASLLGPTELDTPALARLLGRGLRSGVGIAGFDRGGLLLDGGPGRDGRPAPLLARLTLPAEWRVLLVLDPDESGLAGDRERSALAGLPPFGRTQAAAVCHEVLMRVLPAAADGDFPAFAEGLSEVQRLLGAHFAPAQSGRAYLSPRVAPLMAALAEAAPRLLGQPAGIGQSSWGPTGFAVLPSAAAAETLVAALRAEGRLPPGLALHVVAPRNEGARLLHLPAETAAPGPCATPDAALHAH